MRLFLNQIGGEFRRLLALIENSELAVFGYFTPYQLLHFHKVLKSIFVKLTT